MKLTEGFNLLATAPDGIKRLRELILSLAVQGKLVPQDTNEAPASELLMQIRAEKDRLIAEGKIKKDKPLPTIVDEGKPFELPDGWEWSLLGDVVNVIRGITFPANEKTREAALGRIACLRTTNVQNAIEWDDLLFVDRSFMGREEQVIQQDDIVMSMANSRELVGKVAIIKSIPVNEATFGGFLSVLRPHLVSAQYAMIILRTGYARNCLIDSASQTTNIANISLAKLRPLPIPLPPLAEQSRIVAKVEELMALCDELEMRGKLEAGQHARLTATLFDALAASESAHQLQENWARLASNFDLVLDRPEAVDALEQTLLQLAVRGLLVEQDPNDEPASELLKQIRAEKDRLIAEGKIKKDNPLPAINNDEKPFELPQGWEWASLNQVSSKITDGEHSTPQRAAFGHYLLSARNVTNEGIILHDVDYVPTSEFERIRKRCDPDIGDILISCSGSVGRVALVDKSNTYSMVRSAAMVRPCGDNLNRAYLALSLKSPEVQLQMKAKSRQSAQANLFLGAISSLIVPLPPIAEQSRIVSRVEALRALCANLRERLAASQKIQTHLAEALVENAA
ncbi:restriction endonuclease subunit S [Paraburkholderia aromaticivorans]|uniref:restriction endonuclease subunit S n=1 Tax=Paraburkholderia aromaticivorans TaxID=2026199 RepID=UPI0038B76AA6